MQKEELNNIFVISLNESVFVDQLEIIFKSNNYPVIDKAYRIDRTPGFELGFRFDKQFISSAFYSLPTSAYFFNYQVEVMESFNLKTQLKLRVVKI